METSRGRGWGFLWVSLICLLAFLAIWWAIQMARKKQGGAPDRLIIARSLDVPVLDGGPDDLIYARGETVTLSGAKEKFPVRVSLIHSGADLYVLFQSIPRAAKRVIVRVDPDHSRGKGLLPGDYEFELNAEGVTAARQADAKGTVASLKIRKEEFDGQIRSAGDNWNAELRISLDWLGGFGRIDGLALAAEGENREWQLAWPSQVDARAPESWGEIVLAPVAPESAVAGSVFFDGGGGHLVIPYSKDLNPSELTIEAWARVVDRGGGTLIGNGRGHSYWMALGDELKFSPGGAVVNTSTRQLGDTWHHLAVTMDEKGVRTFYVDGEVDRRVGGNDGDDERGEMRKDVIKSGLSDQMLLIGSDREAPDNEKNLHGYVRDLRIWNRVRTRKEIRETAFQRLTGHEPGLVGLWPFTNGLQDLAGGHHAGFVGDASLARDKPTMDRFPAPPAGPPLTFSKREKAKPWEGAIPLLEHEVKIDGVGNAAEYQGAAKIPLEPERKNSMRIAHTRTGLVLFTGVLFGQQNAKDGVTIWVNGDGERRAAPGPSDLRFRFSPDGTVESATGDGHDFRIVAIAGVTTKTISGKIFAPQDDIRPIKTPWWESEVHIPWEALGASAPVKQLHFAVEYRGSVLDSAKPDTSPEEKIEGRWPAAFDPVQPQTWGIATTAPAIVPVPGPRITGTTQPGGSQILKGDAPSPPVPASTPTVTMLTHFAVQCPGGYLDQAAYATDTESKWPHVDPTDHWFVMAEGRISEEISAKVSHDDSPLIHDSHDVDTKIDVTPESAWLVLGSEEGERKLVLETESMRFPTHVPLNTGNAFHYRPWDDDHVTVVGDWVFDCGHGAKTEIHPIYLIESDHEEVRPFVAGKPMQRVRVVRVSMNSDPGARSATLGSFAFSVKAPIAATKLFLKVKNGDPNLVTATLNGDKVDFVIEPPAPQGEYHFELEVGALDATKAVGARLYEVRIPSLLVHNDMDDGLNGSGEWYMAAGVNGHWRQLLWNRSVDTGEPVSFANNFNLPRFFTTADPASGAADLVMEVTAYEEDSVLAESVMGIGDKSTDDLLSSGRFDLGSLATLAQGDGKHTLDTPDWRLNYLVADITDNNNIVPSILEDSFFWEARLANEPNDSLGRATKVGPLAIPAKGEVTSQLSAFLTGAPFSVDRLRLLTPDEDWYSLSFSDYADVTAEVTSGQVAIELAPVSELPAELAEKFGAKKYQVRVFGNPLTSGDESYTVTVRRKAKEIEPDPGEADDDNGGRIVDLTKVPPTKVTPKKKTVMGERRDREMDWAWQHVLDDIDRYQVIVPAVSKEKIPTFCPYNKPAKLEVSAFGMHLSIPALGLEDDNEILLDAATLTPETPVLVEISARPGQARGFYRFNAEWTDALILTPKECELQGEVEKVKKRNPTYRRIPNNPWFYSGKGPGLPDPPVNEDIFSWSATPSYQEVLLESGDSIDSILLAEPGRAWSARLYDGNGVLLAESERTSAAGAGSGRSPSGLTPQGRLRAVGLETGMRYLIQLIPAAGNEGTPQKARVGLQVHPAEN